jgi:predicted RNA-binding Zn ribbon-like protein
MDTPRYEQPVVGGRRCLDLVNTVGGMRPDRTTEYLPGYGDLVAWAIRAGVIAEARGRKLLTEASARPAEAERVLAEARAFREAIHDAVMARLDRREPPSGAVAALNETLGRALARRRLAPTADGLDLAWDDDPAALDAPLWPVAADAADLLTSSADLARVRICGAAGDARCGWLFLDETRNRSRRWCSMEDCGNRAKARRHYHRSRGAPQ